MEKYKKLIIMILVALVIIGAVYLLLRSKGSSTSYQQEINTRQKEIQTDVLTGKPTQ